MPIPNFVPLVGSGFDNLAGQQLGWAGFSRGVEESNLSRAAEAQRVQNDWLRTVAQGAQSAADRDAADQQAAMSQNAKFARDAAMQANEQNNWERKFQSDKSQFEVSKAAENRRTAFDESKLDWQKQQFQDQQKQAEDALDSGGKYYAANLHKTYSDAENANANYVKVLKQQADLQADQERLNGKKLSERSEDDKRLMAMIPKRLAELKAQLALAQRAKDQSDRKHNALLATMGRDGYAPLDDYSGVRNDRAGKTWTFKNAMQDVKASGALHGDSFLQNVTPDGAGTGADAPDGTASDAPSPWLRSFSGNDVPAFSVPSAPAAVAPIMRGRFKVFEE